MKPFNLEKALQGEPVLLRDGNKAFIFKNILDTPVLGYIPDYPLVGMVQNRSVVQTWAINGRISTCDDCADGDIIGMWEEPKLTIPELMEKALNENLPVKSRAFGLYHTGFKVIAKTQDGSDYILQAVGGDNAQVYLQSAVSKMDDDWSIA